MKTAIAVDSLLLRDEATFMVELVLNLFPNSELYTIVHRQGAILGSIERRPIVSSFLTHRSKGPDPLRKSLWLLPSAVKGIPLHPSIEKVIVISRGHIHGLTLPAHVERLLYVLEWDLVNQSGLGLQRLFCPYVNDWRERGLQKYPKIAVSSEALRTRLELPNAEVIVPTYRTEEYPFIRDEDHNFSFTHHLIHTQGLSVADFQTLAAVLLSKNETVRVLGPDSHLAAVKAQFPALEFGGDHCEATSALYSHQAKAIWDLSTTFFPARAFGALATGRPAVVRDVPVNRELLTVGAHFLKELSSSAIEEMHLRIEESYLSEDRKILRRAGLKWNERLFKSRMSKFLDARNS